MRSYVFSHEALGREFMVVARLRRPRSRRETEVPYARKRGGEVSERARVTAVRPESERSTLGQDESGHQSGGGPQPIYVQNIRVTLE